MSVGTAIFLFSLMLATVILYGITKDRWRWRRIVANIARALALFALLALVVMAALVLEKSRISH
jgi:ABC-type nickel/cobalt efflux system permease component RcnA